MLAALFTILFLQLPVIQDTASDVSIALGDEYKSVIQDRYISLVPESQMLEKLQSSPNSRLPSRLSLLVWNVWKGQGQADFTREFRLLSNKRHLVLFQEAVQDNQMLSLFKTKKNYSFQIAKSFYSSEGISTGVATGAVSEPSGSLAIRSLSVESFVVTPKMMLANIYVLENGERLLVVNIHGLNFVLNSEFKEQIDLIIPYLRNFKGKAIFAGDFNTWNPGRTKYLTEKMTEAGFQHATFADDSRFLHLDHFFTRGCQIINADLHAWAKGSDHYPITVNLDCH